MRTIQIKVYRYDELSERAQGRARDWFRRVSAEDSHELWSEHVTEDLKTVARFMGWTITDTRFSGFASQGDGAQFHGYWRAADMREPATLERHAPAQASVTNAGLRAIMLAHVAIAQAAPDASADVRGRGRYVHSMATVFDSDSLDDEQLAGLAEAARNLMDWYYGQLEASYDHQYSDDVVAETIRANEYEFEENGDRFAR